MHAIAIDFNERYLHYSEFFYELKSPEKVKPYFSKGAPLIERSPITFYKIGFLIMLALEAITFVLYISK
jgi:hypothetical protein